MLDGIQDLYTSGQPGIIKQVGRLKELVARIDGIGCINEGPLAQHLHAQGYLNIFTLGVEFLQFSFRWFNCLLMRELKTSLIIRMWDCYQVI